MDQLPGSVQKADQTAAAPADVVVWAGHSLPGGQLAFMQLMKDMFQWIKQRLQRA